MKTLLTPFILAALLCGCSDSKQVADLSKRVGLLESETKLLLLDREQFLRDIEGLQNATARYATNLSDDLKAIHKLQDKVANLEDHYHAHNLEHATAGNAPAKVVYQVVGAATPPTSKPSAATKRGVPVSIYNDLSRRAASEWPGNFSMQEYELNRQIEAYRKLHP